MSIPFIFLPVIVLMTFTFITWICNGFTFREPRTILGVVMSGLTSVVLAIVVIIYVILIILHLFTTIKFV